jgi:hypothetical protein
MTTPRLLTLQLSTKGHENYLQLHFVGLLSEEMKASRRRRFLRLASLLAWPAPLRVVISADESGSWDWAEEWTGVLEDMRVGLELRFKVREARHGQ